MTVVGTGIAVGAHLTTEARYAIESADVVLHVGGNAFADEWLRTINPATESLQGLYETGTERTATYDAMVRAVAQHLEQDRHVCLALYGHPGVYAYPGWAAIRRASELGVPARMLPGISSEDSLFVDLQVDPGERGWQSYEATDFLTRNRSWDVNTPLVLWQITSIGESRAIREVNTEGVGVLASRLAGRYGSDHEVTVYLAAHLPGTRPVIERLPLADLGDADVPPLATLYVPPLGEPDIDWEMAQRLGLSGEASGS